MHVCFSSRSAPQTSYETNTLFVSQLPLNLDENAIRTLFTEAGGVKDVRLIRNGKLGASKGYGYVEMADEVPTTHTHTHYTLHTQHRDTTHHRDSTQRHETQKHTTQNSRHHSRPPAHAPLSVGLADRGA